MPVRSVFYLLTGLYYLLTGIFLLAYSKSSCYNFEMIAMVEDCPVLSGLIYIAKRLRLFIYEEDEHNERSGRKFREEHS